MHRVKSIDQSVAGRTDGQWVGRVLKAKVKFSPGDIHASVPLIQWLFYSDIDTSMTVKAATNCSGYTKLLRDKPQCSPGHFGGTKYRQTVPKATPLNLTSLNTGLVAVRRAAAVAVAGVVHI